MKTYQDQFEEALRLREQGDLPEAQRILEGLVASQPRSAALFAVLGDLYWDLGFLDKSISSFRTATQIATRSEDASLGLFHTLWQAGREDEAFDEMKRFMNISNSEEYRELIKNMIK